jgi:tRNA (guanine10-N2)-methyltransferase
MLCGLIDPSGPGVYRAASQYNVRDRLLDCATFDVTLNPWRRGGILDAIVTDPPCEFFSSRFIRKH